MKQFANECILVMGAKTQLPYFIEAFLCWDFPNKKEGRPKGGQSVFLCWDFPNKKEGRPKGGQSVFLCWDFPIERKADRREANPFFYIGIFL
jgi:hypothetical protein